MFGGALFDMDGVLIDTRRSIVALWQEIADDYDVRLTMEDIHRDILGCAAEHTIDAVFGALPSSDRQHILARIRIAELELAFDKVPGARTLVGELDRAGVRLGLVTGGSPERVRRVLDRLGLGSAFGGLVAWGDVARGKPAPDCYLLGADRIGVSAPDCLVFEDTASGIAAALAAGATCVGIGDGQLAGHGARHVVADLTALRCKPHRNGMDLVRGATVIATLLTEATR